MCPCVMDMSWKHVMTGHCLTSYVDKNISCLRDMPAICMSCAVFSWER